MKSPCIVVWKLEDAPKELRLLYKGLETPAWVALVPHEIRGRDLDETLMGNPNSESVSRYQTPNGEVYFGTPRVGNVSLLAQRTDSKSTRLSSR